MYVLIIALACISHLSMTAMEQQQIAPTSPHEEVTSRPETPSDSEHTVKFHLNQRLSRIASASIASTSSRSSISSLELASPRSSTSSEQPGTSPIAPLQIKTESPKNATPIRVSPKSKSSVPNARDLFPQGYLTNTRGSVSVVAIDDEDASTWKLFCFCTVCTVGTLVGVVFGIYEAITRS